MIHTVLKSEDISSVAQSIEMRKFTTFLERQIFHNYSELYKLPKLVELLTKCAYEEKREPEQHAILALIPHLHKCKSSLKTTLLIYYHIVCQIKLTTD